MAVGTYGHVCRREAPVAAVLGVFSSLSVDMTAEEDEFGNIDEFEISK